MGGGGSKAKQSEVSQSAPAPAPAPPPSGQGESEVVPFMRKPTMISPPPDYKAPFKPALGAAPVGAPVALKQVKGSGAFSVESLLKQAHEGIDLGKRASLLFDSFDADKNGIIDNEELSNLITAMLKTTLNTIREANREAVRKAVKQRPQDEDSIKAEADGELAMIEPYAEAQIKRAGDIALEMRKEMDDNGDGAINKEEFIHEVTNCLKAYADFNVC